MIYYILGKPKRNHDLAQNRKTKHDIVLANRFY